MRRVYSRLYTGQVAECTSTAFPRMSIDSCARDISRSILVSRCVGWRRGKGVVMCMYVYSVIFENIVSLLREYEGRAVASLLAPIVDMVLVFVYVMVARASDCSEAMMQSCCD